MITMFLLLCYDEGERIIDELALDADTIAQAVFLMRYKLPKIMERRPEIKKIRLVQSIQVFEVNRG